MSAENGKQDWFPFKPKDFLGDEHVMLMSALECGAYIRLLCLAWDGHPIGTLSNSDTLLAKLSNLTAEEWVDHKDAILRPFELIDGRWHQKRLKAEAEIIQHKYKVFVESGARGADKRWEQSSPVISETAAKKKNDKPPISKEKLIEELQVLYPKVNVVAEFSDARAWILLHRDRQFTQRFFTNWVKKASKDQSNQLLSFGTNGHGPLKLSAPIGDDYPPPSEESKAKLRAMREQLLETNRNKMQ